MSTMEPFESSLQFRLGKGKGGGMGLNINKEASYSLHQLHHVLGQDYIMFLRQDCIMFIGQEYIMFLAQNIRSQFFAISEKLSTQSIIKSSSTNRKKGVRGAELLWFQDYLSNRKQVL